MSYINNRILIALLKNYGINQLVLSPGMRNIPFVSEVEIDPFFECYSVVDERNAAFFALGLSQEKGNVPVALACTSGTAVSNYLSGITEAFYSNVPIIVISFDRSPYALDQLETQKIDQLAVFHSVVKKAVQLPMIKDDEDVWYCQRVINEALIAMSQHGNGPVQINVPLSGDTNMLNERSNANIHKPRKIDYYTSSSFDSWKNAYTKMQSFRRILIVMGQNVPLDRETKVLIRNFTEKYCVPVLADNLCNFKCNELVMAEGLIKGLGEKTITPFLPELVISFGHNFQERIKDLLKAHAGEFEHWLVDEEGKIKDVFQSQSALFESSIKDFFTYFTRNVDVVSNDDEYLHLWKYYEANISLPAMPWTNFYAIQEFAKVIPNNSLLHMSILNSTRLVQFFKLDESVRVYANVNSFGIDGCFPTFIGQATATNDLSFLVIGDLSFFYGMNAASIKHIKNNVRILMLNNGGAAEFHIPSDSHNRETVDLHIGCAHANSAKGWVKSLGYQYIVATDKESLADGLKQFISKSTVPILMEVFTDMKVDGPYVLNMYRYLEEQIGQIKLEN